MYCDHIKPRSEEGSGLTELQTDDEDYSEDENVEEYDDEDNALFSGYNYEDEKDNSHMQDNAGRYNL